MADLITDKSELNNEASPVEICFSKTGERLIRLFEEETVLTEIIETAPIHVRERALICDNYFLLSDGSDAHNVLGHYFNNTIYRISDGMKMTSFSSDDIPTDICSRIKF